MACAASIGLNKATPAILIKDRIKTMTQNQKPETYFPKPLIRNPKKHLNIKTRNPKLEKNNLKVNIPKDQNAKTQENLKTSRTRKKPKKSRPKFLKSPKKKKS